MEFTQLHCVSSLLMLTPTLVTRARPMHFPPDNCAVAHCIHRESQHGPMSLSLCAGIINQPPQLVIEILTDEFELTSFGMLVGV